MADQINLTIDGQLLTVAPDTTILHAAAQAGIHIPTICYLERCTANALCRLCVVEVEGARTLVASCVAKVSEGMTVRTQTERVRMARRTILEMLADSTDLSESPEIQAYLKEYQAEEHRFEGAHRRVHPVLDDNPMYIRDYSKCILCWRCIQVCAEDAQYTFAINLYRRGYDTQIGTFYNHPMPETTCVFCGQCVGVCPTGALKPKREWLLELGYTPDQMMSMSREERRQNHRHKDQPTPAHEGGAE